MTIHNHRVLFKDTTDNDPMLMAWEGMPLSALVVLIVTLVVIIEI